MQSNPINLEHLLRLLAFLISVFTLDLDIKLHLLRELKQKITNQPWNFTYSLPKLKTYNLAQDIITNFWSNFAVLGKLSWQIGNRK